MLKGFLYCVNLPFLDFLENQLSGFWGSLDMAWSFALTIKYLLIPYNPFSDLMYWFVSIAETKHGGQNKSYN